MAWGRTVSSAARPATRASWERLIASVPLIVGCVWWTLAMLAPSARAGEFDVFDDADRAGAYEAWGGADASAHAWFAYSGVTVAPWGDIHADGFRLRAVQGVGGYDYLYDAATRVKVRKSVSDLIIGYQFGVDELTVKMLAGWSVLAREFTVPSLGAREQRIEHGFKLATELWLDWSEATWASLDVGYAQPRSTVDARLRLGMRFDNEVSIGPEVVFNRTDLSGEVIAVTRNYGTARVGMFARYDWFGGEVSAAGGLAADIVGSSSTGATTERYSPYGAFTLLFQF